MTLVPGTRLGPYEVVAPLGAGGMGEVYRARDTRPQVAREVAIKLVSGVALDAAAVSRFEREARITAALAHPNVVALFDVGVHEGTPYLVEELLTGETLRERMRSGPVTARKAVEWMRQVTLGLAAAHARELVHRDVKPENIFLTSDGHVKLLDFGLAKAAAGPAPDATTAAQAATATGDAVTSGQVVLGTVGYMSPEQVRGQALDHRSDIFSVGVVLYELLTGRRPFDRATAADTLSAILTADPAPLSQSGAPVPAALERLVARCLEKAPADRFQSTRDLAFALDTVAGTEAVATTALPHADPRRIGWLPWVAGGLALLAGVAFGRLVSLPAGGDGSPRPPQRLSILLDPARGLSENSGPALAISPSGDAIAYVDTYEGGLTLFVRSLSETAPRIVRGSAGASAPFFSADGRWVAFGAPGGLKRAPLSGGDPEMVCPTGSTNFRGGAWGADDRIVFTTVIGLMEVRANGDGCRLIAATDRANRESFFSRPQILANGDILVTTTTVSDDVDGASLDVVTTGGTRRRLVKGARDGRLLPSGHLLFARGDVLHATRVDANVLAASPDEVRVPERIALGAFGHLSFDVANDGTLVYWSANDIRGRRVLVWVDRQGRRADAGAPPRSYVAEPMLSPDAGLVAVPVGDADHFMWLFSLAQKSLTPVWLDRDAHSAVWSPDGRRIAFQAGTDGTRLGARIAFKDVDSAAPPTVSEVVQSDGRVSPASWAPNGRDLAFVVQSPDSGLDVGVLDVTTNAHRILLGSTAQETRPAYSPDGRWLAYESNESGQPEVYVTDVKDMAMKRQVSVDGGVDPVWSHDGRELFYLRAATMMAAPVVGGSSLTASRPAVLFSGVESSPNFKSYSVAPDGRFLLRSSPARHDGPSNHVTVVLNWLDELRRLLPIE